MMNARTEWTVRTCLCVTAWLAVCLLLSLAAHADDWPQWRGMHRDGKSTDTGLLQKWPEGGPPLEFRASGLGAGYSSVSYDLRAAGDEAAAKPRAGDAPGR